MGSIISAINDDYDDYVSLCKKHGVEPKDSYFWSYEDSAVVEMMESKKISFKEAQRICRIQSALDKLIKRFKDLKEDAETAMVELKALKKEF